MGCTSMLIYVNNVVNINNLVVAHIIGHTMDPTMVNRPVPDASHGKNVLHEMDHGTAVHGSLVVYHA